MTVLPAPAPPVADDTAPFWAALGEVSRNDWSASANTTKAEPTEG